MSQIDDNNYYMNVRLVYLIKILKRFGRKSIKNI